MLRLPRQVWTQLVILAAITTIAIGVMAFGFVNVPALIGIGRYTVTVDLPATGGLYPTSVVTYRGTEIGRVKSVDVTRDGVRAVLTLNSATAMPSDVRAAVHSRSAVGEQFLELTPQTRCDGRRRAQATRRRRHSGWQGAGSPRYRKSARRHQHSAASHPAGQSAHRHRRSRQGRRRPWAGTVTHRRRFDVVGDRGRQVARPDRAADRPVAACPQFSSADSGFDRDLGAAHCCDHRPAQGAGHCLRGSPRPGRPCAGRRQSAVRSGRPRVAGAAGQSGESRRYRGDLPQ